MKETVTDYNLVFGMKKVIFMKIKNYKEKNKIIFPYLKCHFLAEIRLPGSPCVFRFLEENRDEGGGRVS